MLFFHKLLLILASHWSKRPVKNISSFIAFTKCLNYWTYIKLIIIKGTKNVLNGPFQEQARLRYQKKQQEKGIEPRRQRKPRVEYNRPSSSSGAGEPNLGNFWIHILTMKPTATPRSHPWHHRARRCSQDGWGSWGVDPQAAEWAQAGGGRAWPCLYCNERAHSTGRGACWSWPWRRTKRGPICSGVLFFLAEFKRPF